MRSYGVFHPACRDEILSLAFAKHVHFSHATQLFNDFGVFLYLFARKSIALARYLILSYNTNIKLSKKCYIKGQNPKFISDFIPVSGMACSYGKIFIPPTYDLGKFKRDLGKRASSLSHMNAMKILIGKQLRGEIIGRRDVPLSGII